MNDTTKFARKLALQFSDGSDIPNRFKKGNTKRDSPNSSVEQRFQKNTNTWKRLIDTMLSKMDNEKAWRFILRTPDIEPQLKSAAYSKDFMDFTGYFVLRRDVEQCDDDELGFLSMLYTEFQRRLEALLEKKERTVRI